ncbi:MAG: accessory factor UbiK family protein [Rickettsiales bacterium]
MQKDSKLFEDFARMASSATGTLFDMKREVDAMIAAQMEKFLSKTNLVSRDEFEAVKLMAEKARAENETLRKELENLKKSK